MQFFVFFNDVQTREEQNQMDCVSLKKKTPSDPGADLLRARSDLRVCVDTNHPRSWSLQWTSLPRSCPLPREIRIWGQKKR